MEYNGYKPGYIYVLKSGPYYKIGYADNVDQRLKSVSAASKPDDMTDPIELLFSFKTTSKLIAERHLHTFFDRFRVKGEWFRLRPQDVETLRVFTGEYTVDQFVLDWCKLPDEAVLFSEEDIEFCRKFSIRFGGILPDGLEEYVKHERAKRALKSRAARYRKMLIGLLESMDIDDLEWLVDAAMRRGVRETPSIIDVVEDELEA